MISFEFPTWDDVPEDFTGKCKLTEENAEVWFLNGEPHHDTKPAYVSCSFIDGKPDNIKWYSYGRLHRLDGPAYTFGRVGYEVFKSYYIFDYPYNEQDYYELPEVKWNPTRIQNCLESIVHLDSDE